MVMNNTELSAAWIAVLLFANPAHRIEKSRGERVCE
jgi:hypothetical protein